jgi:hypothetical protein
LLLAAVLTIVCLSLLGQVSKYFLGHDNLKGFVPTFYVDYESNVPTWYSAFQLALAAGLLAMVAAVKTARHAPFRRHWAALSLIFFLLSIDEVAMIHEYPIDPLRRALGAGGLLYYTWVIPGAAFVALVGLGFCRFLRHLPERTRNGFLLAGAVFVGGAIGVEMLSGLQADLYGEENFIYAMIITVEELLEMIGIVLFIHTLWEYLSTEVDEVHLRLGRAVAG